MANVTITIERDIDPSSPMDDDGSWTLVTFHSRHMDNRSAHDFLEIVDGKVRFIDEEMQKKENEGFAYMLDYYDHGEGKFSIHGSRPQCQFDTSRYCGVLLWNHPPEDMGAKTPEDRRKDAQSFLDYYNDWANGHVYGYITKRGKDEESCWGFYTDSISEAACEIVKAGDLVIVEGECAFVFDDDALPEGAKLVDEFPEEDEEEFVQPKQKLVLAQLEVGDASAVILNGTTIYTEDDDEGHSQEFTAEMIASRLSESLNIPVTKMTLTEEEAGGDEWNFQTVEEFVNNQ